MKYVLDFVVYNMLRTVSVELCNAGNGKCTAKVTGTFKMFGYTKHFVTLRRVELPAKRKRDYLKEVWFDEASKLSSPNEGTIFSPVKVKGGIR